MSLQEEITQHERRLKERDSYNRAVWLALMEGRTPPEKPKPRFRPESFFEPRKFKKKQPAKCLEPFLGL